ncbi:sugar transferase [Edaphobacter aggregans]|uniref:sugar transferase n=1 Tax=Edaphobacter aggregans TaxID=570835 RepID=UPI00068DB48C|nr:sugar transferase [Edaphobacter aggregans]
MVDIIVAALSLFLLLPAIVLISLAILISSGKPIIFVQKRLGRHGQEFGLLKFRTMKVAAQRGPGVTCDGDSRITKIGRWLRKHKLDELPQLVNVLKGEMTLVGPRPDLEEFWSKASPEDRRVLELTPGVTGLASLAFCDEERLLAQVPADQLASFYLQQVLPQKSRLDSKYAARATFRSDCGILLRTALVPLLGRHWIEREVTTGEIDEQVS